MERLIVGISGASGLPYGVRLLETLAELPVEVHLVSSEAARLVNEHEGDGDWERILGFADVVYDNKDMAAAIASGSFRTSGMVIIPCSMTTLGKLAAGIGDNLITRAAMCQMKERRGLVLVPRETPLSTIHLENMTKLSQAGAIIAPAMPAFYNQPKSLEDNLDFMVGRVLDLFGFDTKKFKRWGD